ncbi:WW domain-containing protein [Diaporthe eres]|uniref:WW domain-containing protein n=1 Tax=Diaporthe vaccinii TaxID=105482 RepID=A0ABR4FG03_9PEZI|nr:WW domain-containing protein [Diaporthe eres]
MSGPGSPGQEGPTFAPPHLPAGWIAQWDANSKKYYYVQLSTGVSQWDVPTDAAPVGGGTPASTNEHPYGVPGQRQLITHPDGTQTVKHPDGSLEPVMPNEAGGTRGIDSDGPAGDRGLGSMAMNALLGGKQSGSGSGHNSNSSPFGGLANQVISGLTQSNGGGHGQQHHGSSAASSGLGGKIVGQLTSNLFSSGNKPSQPQNYHSGQSSQAPHNSGGLAGSMMGSVAHMFGGQPGASNQNFGYTNSGQTGTYSGSAPPATYQTPGASSQHQSPAQGHNAQPTHNAQPANTPSSYHAPQHTPSFPPPPNQYEGQHGYQGQQQQHTPYGQHGQIPGPPAGAPPAQYGQSQYGQGYGHQQAPPAYGGHQQGGYNGVTPSFPPPPSQYQSQAGYGGQDRGLPHGAHHYGSNPAY